MWSDMGSLGWSHGWGVFGTLHMVVWWIVLVLVIVVLAKWLSGRDSERKSPPQRSALEVLSERYARGEIKSDEFEVKKRDLNG